MADKELNPEKAEELWNKMDDLGYAGRLGSNKPEATRLVQKAHQKPDQEKPLSALEPSQNVQPPLMPVTESERREATSRATEGRLQPSGHYRRRRARLTSIDGASHMSGINEVGMRRALSKR